MKISKDSRMAILALLPMILVISVPLLSAATSAQPVISEGQLVNLLASYGFINLDDPVPYHVFAAAFGHLWATILVATGMTWLQFRNWATFFSIPFAIAAMFVPGAAVICGLIGIGFITIGA